MTPKPNAVVANATLAADVRAAFEAREAETLGGGEVCEYLANLGPRPYRNGRPLGRRALLDELRPLGVETRKLGRGERRYVRHEVEGALRRELVRYARVRRLRECQCPTRTVPLIAGDCDSTRGDSIPRRVGFIEVGPPHSRDEHGATCVACGRSVH